MTKEQIDEEVNKILQRELIEGNGEKEFSGACALIGEYGDQETVRLWEELVKKNPQRFKFFSGYLALVKEDVFLDCLRNKILFHPETYGLNARLSAIKAAFKRYETGSKNFKVNILAIAGDYIEVIEDDYYVVSKLDKFLIKEVRGYKNSEKRKANAHRRGWKEMPVDFRPPPMLESSSGG